MVRLWVSSSMVEQLTLNQLVQGSSPCLPTFQKIDRTNLGSKILATAFHYFAKAKWLMEKIRITSLN
jgi:hypothetical protein